MYGSVRGLRNHFLDVKMFRYAVTLSSDYNQSAWNYCNWKYKERTITITRIML